MCTHFFPFDIEEKRHKRVLSWVSLTLRPREAIWCWNGVLLVPRCTQAKNVLQEHVFPSTLADFPWAREAQGPIVIKCATKLNHMRIHDKWCICFPNLGRLILQ